MVEGIGWAREQCPLTVAAIIDVAVRKIYRGKNIMLSLLFSFLPLLLLSRNSTQWLYVIKQSLTLA